MKIKATKSFSGLIALSKGQEAETDDIAMVNDLVSAGYIEVLEEEKKAKSKKV